MGYVIAAYGIVLGSLLAYGVWLQVQRRAAMRQARDLAGATGSTPGAGDEGAPPRGA